jgi:NAD(P)-dependent dehydrogenase (short-subunit alcohol dehydrogenase family)
MVELNGQVALVTGASRGIGKGIALAIAAAGATVYITGRTTEQGEMVDGLGGTVFETAKAVETAGGRCVPLPCDHRDDEQVEAVFARLLEETGRLDVLVNNVCGGYQHMVEQRGDKWVFSWEDPFWEQPRWRWDAMFAAGVRAHFVSSQLAAAQMVQQRQGLIVTISFWAGQKYLANVPYGVAKAADDRMVADMAQELKPYNVAAISLYPCLVRTEAVMRAAEHFDLTNSESPQFSGRAISALAADPDVMAKSGQVLVAAALAKGYGFTDIDGKVPRPLTLEAA